ERYRGIVETAHEGIWSLDRESRFDFVSQRLADMLGYAPDEMVGRALFDVLPEAIWSKAALRVERAREGASEEGELTVLRKDGTEIWALIKTRPILTSDGAYAGILAMVTDLTRPRQAEESLRRSEEQYRQLVETTTD